MFRILEEKKLESIANILDLNNYEKQNNIYISKYYGFYQVKEKSTGKIYAAKILDTERKDEYKYGLSTPRKCFNNQVKYLSQVDHPSIIHLEGYSPCDFENNDNPLMIMEYCSNGTLSDLFKNERNQNPTEGWDSTKKLMMIYGIASSMKQLHSQNIIHRNLLPSSIFLDDFLTPKLACFKYCIDSTKNNEILDLEDPMLHYLPPEFFLFQSYTKSSEVYSFSLIVYEILTNNIPYIDISTPYLLSKFLLEQNGRPILEETIPECYRQLLEECWSQNPERRPSFEDVVEILETDKRFIKDDIDQKAYYEYIRTLNKYFESTIEERHTLRQTINLNYKKITVNKNYYDESNLRQSLSEIKILNLLNYKKSDRIGKGSFGEVYLTYEIKSNKKTATKIFIPRRDFDSFVNEAKILSKLNHPSIVEFIGYESHDFEKKLRPVIMIQFAKNGSLRDIINNKLSKSSGVSTDTMKLIIIYGIAAGMSYIHSKNIIHCDLKPENILIDDNFYPLISDFGLSMQCTTYKGNRTIGTCPYLAPEIWNDCIYSKASDVYAFAIIVYEIVTNKEPFPDLNDIIVMNKVLEKDERPEFDKSISPHYKQLIESCWNKDEESRLTFDEIVLTLETDSNFLSNVKKDIFMNYVNHIKNFLKRNSF